MIVMASGHLLPIIVKSASRDDFQRDHLATVFSERKLSPDELMLAGRSPAADIGVPGACALFPGPKNVSPVRNRVCPSCTLTIAHLSTEPVPASLIAARLFQIYHC